MAVLCGAQFLRVSRAGGCGRFAPTREERPEGDRTSDEFPRKFGLADTPQSPQMGLKRGSPRSWLVTYQSWAPRMAGGDEVVPRVAGLRELEGGVVAA